MDLEVHELGLGARVRHPELGIGVVFDLDEHQLDIFFKDHGERKVATSFEGLVVIASGPEIEVEVEHLDTEAVKDALREVLDEFGAFEHPVELGSKWEGGTLMMRPADPNLKSKEVPVEAFFHKIVMMRDRLRVLEQKINAHAVLTDADKVELQQYITRCYGSMTTFNVLFADKDDHFVGSSSQD